MSTLKEKITTNRSFLQQQGFTDKEINSIKNQDIFKKMVNEANTRLFQKVATNNSHAKIT